jgi:hypothetical protein
MGTLPEIRKYSNHLGHLELLFQSARRRPKDKEQPEYSKSPSIMATMIMPNYVPAAILGRNQFFAAHIYLRSKGAQIYDQK